jgi:hypothetical protein
MGNFYSPDGLKIDSDENRMIIGTQNSTIGGNCFRGGIGPGININGTKDGPGINIRWVR